MLTNILRAAAPGLVVAAVFAQAAPITLSDCVRSALEKNPSAAAAAWRIQQSQAGLSRTRAPYYPQLKLGGSYATSDNPSRAFMMQLNQQQLNMSSPDFDPNDPDRAENFNIYAQLGYRLYDGGKRGIQNDQARTLVTASSAQRDAIHNALVFQVVESYLNALKANDLAKVHEQTAQSLQESLRVATERVAAGTAVRTDVLNLEVRIAEQQQHRIHARNATSIAIEALNTAIGAPLMTAQQLTPPSHPVPTGTPPDAATTRPEQTVAHAMTEAQRLAHRGASRAIAPKIDLFGQLDLDTEQFDETADSYFAGVSLNWDAFDGFSRRYETASAEAAWRAARAEEQHTNNTVLFEQKQASLLLQESRQRLEVAKRSVTSAEEALRMTQAQYEQGTADITALLVAQVGHSSAQTHQTAAAYDLRLAHAELMRAHGEIAQHFAHADNPSETHP